ncbi:MAG: FHA domain-containing protein [Myxococcota bacterium]|nr:FHA domain-containing protein [Myxococcota bacterium]
MSSESVNNSSDVSTDGKTPAPIQLHVRIEVDGKPPRDYNYDFQQREITFGRDPDNDIQVPLTTVSRNHARIFFEQGDYFLEDLNSTHGTKHNDSRLGKHEKKLLRDGDEISIMSFSVKFQMNSAYMLERKPGEKTEHMARRMVQEIISSVAGTEVEPTTIRIMNGVNEGTRYDFKDSQTEVVLGRSPECDVIIDDHNASRRHCLIKRTWNGYTAQDLGSKNGVLINGESIQGVLDIKDSDELQIGGVKLLFIDPASRLLNQFGGPADNTAMESRVTVGPGEMPSEEESIESYEEEYSSEEYESEEHSESSIGYDEESIGDPEQSFSGEDYSESEVDDELQDAENEPEEGDLELPSVTTSSAKGEIAILLIGLGIFLAAVAVFVFLKI